MSCYSLGDEQHWGNFFPIDTPAGILTCYLRDLLVTYWSHMVTVQEQSTNPIDKD